MRIETIAVHAGHAVDPTTGAVSAPIQLSTTFERNPDGTYASGYVYSRSNNPNRQALEQAVAALEGGVAAAAFGSGVAAAAGVLQALKPGDHVIAADQAYHGITKLLREVMMPWGLEVSFIDLTDLGAVRAALRENTRLVWVETPSNPLLKITDIAAVAELAHTRGAVCVCDNAWAPVLQRPLEHGADFVVHSTTKYIGGHCDLTGGIVVAREDSELFQRIRLIQATTGGVPAPFDCWLALRGVRTLPWRMRAHSESAMRVAEFLTQHPAVERVRYPGLPADPSHELAKRQMSAFSGMMSFDVKGGREAAMRVAAKTKIFIRATSLGGVESLIEHRASIAGEDPRTPQGLLRLSVGLENAEDLIEDLAQALG